MSDYDFAVYFDASGGLNVSEKKLELISEISSKIGTDKVDLVVLNEPLSPELKYTIICEGELVFEREPFRIIVEPQITSQYFDFRMILLRYGLTKKIYGE